MNEELKKACKLLRYYQEWRRGGDGEMPNPRDVGKALDLVLDWVENIPIWKKLERFGKTIKNLVASQIR